MVALKPSPHTRGPPRPRLHALAVHRFIPAYAGSTLYDPYSVFLTEDHPRIPGVHLFMASSRGRPTGSSPHTRGPLVMNLLHQPYHRIIPTYAGSTQVGCRKDRRQWVHPRIRGVHFPSIVVVSLVMGSSPHTRGPPAAESNSNASRGIIPAYAGSTWKKGYLPYQSEDHPRIRGVHGIISSRVMKTQGSSPHTRGPH